MPRLILAVILLFATGLARCQSIAETMAPIAAIAPQPDGVVYLAPSAATIVRTLGKQTSIVTGKTPLKIENNRICRWNADMDRPTWRVNFPTAGFYRVVITRIMPVDEVGAARLNLYGPRPKSLLRTVAPSAAVEPFELGELEVVAGEQTLDFHYQERQSPFACGQLADIRLIPLDRIRAAARGGEDALKRLGIDQLPTIKAISDAIQPLQDEWSLLSTEVRRKGFADFTEMRQFLVFDLARTRYTALEGQLRDLRRQLLSTRLAAARTAGPDAAAKLKPDDAPRLQEYLDALAAAADAETKSYPPGPMPQSPPLRHTLFRTGHFDELPAQPVDDKLPLVTLPVQPPPDADVRRRQFDQRNSPAALADLCRRFQLTLIPGTPGLEAFERLAAAGQYPQALAAYRTYFFDKLANPEKYGAATENILFELTRDRGRGELLLRPNPFVLAQNLAGAAVVQIRNERVVAPVGPPGAVAWAPLALAVPPSAAAEGRVKNDPFWKTPDGIAAARLIEFYRCLNLLPGDRAEYFAGGLFPALLWSYAIGGDKTHLARWCDYVDDWTANAVRDREQSPVGTRCAVELETQFVRCMYNLLRLVLDERPDLATDFDAATLVRLQLHLNEEFVPYLIRARRAQMANWGIMGLCHLMHLGSFMNEFKAMRDFNHEGWRLWNANMIQHRTLDGENAEAWDEGHNGITFEYSTASIPYSRLPAGVDDLDLIAFWDHVRTDARGKLIHISPAGNYWPEWDNQRPASKYTVRSRYRNDPAGRNPYDLVEEEPEFAARLRTLLADGQPADGRLPATFSDLSPYAAMAYLRESWQPDADYLIFQNFRDRCQGQADCSRTAYSLSKNDRILVEAHGLVVDGKPDNRFHSLPRTGGKTDYCAQAGRHVSNDRFHTSPRYDFVEGTQDAPYALHRVHDRDDYGLYRVGMAEPDPAPITDVTACRQIFAIRRTGLWLISDRIVNTGTGPHEYTQFFTVPLRIGAVGYADRARLLAASPTAPIQIDADAGRIRTANPGFENVTVHAFAPAPLQFANTLNGRREHEVAKASLLDTALAALKAGRKPEDVAERCLRQPVSMRWTAAGNQLLTTVLASRPAGEDPPAGEARLVEPLKGDNGAMGCHVIGRDGTEAWLQRSPTDISRLACGPITAQAETLLVVHSPNGATTGIALGAESFTVNGRTTPAPHPDLEFSLAADGTIHLIAPIHRPIDTVTILPEQTCFTDTLEVSFAPPPGDIDLHYTLDGSDPTLQSPRYTTQFAIDRTTMVKVRPLRRGLTETPWNFGGTQSGKTISAIFRRRPALPAVAAGKTESGLTYTYHEGPWPKLMTYAGIPEALTPVQAPAASVDNKGSEGNGFPSATGGQQGVIINPADLLQLRATDGAYAVHLNGFLTVPTTGVYTFTPPPHLFTPTLDAGYDLRLWIDGEEWLPNPHLHAENLWSIPLAAGPHRLRVAFTDYRVRPFRNDYWMAWQAEEMGTAAPVITLTGPNIPPQPIPAAWLSHEK